MDLEKPYDRVNREALQQVLRMYDINGKLLNGIKSMYDDSLACVRINSSRSIMSPWLSNAYMDTAMKVVKIRMGRR